MIKDAEQFKAADKDFQARHEAKSDLEAYIHSVESTISGPELSLKIKRGAKSAVEAELAKALEKLEIEDTRYVVFAEFLSPQLVVDHPLCLLLFYLRLALMSSDELTFTSSELCRRPWPLPLPPDNCDDVF